jgi:ribonuclease HII
VCGVDEVGRGAWAGPLFVGAVVVDATVRPAPAGTRDSKLLQKSAREGLVPRLKRWCRAWAIGEASAGEIDELGLTECLGLAAARAIAVLPDPPDAYILDGPFDYVTRGIAGRVELDAPSPRVHTRVGADGSCSSVAAASVIAKVLRDERMRELSVVHPGYGFDVHAGYGTRAHASAIGDRGPCIEHRRSWSVAAFGADSTERAPPPALTFVNQWRTDLCPESAARSARKYGS